MRKTFSTTIFLALCFATFGQSKANNLDIGLFKNGSNGSDLFSEANLEIALRPVSSVYTKVPAAENMVFFLAAPKADFSVNDVVKIVQTNSSVFGTSGSMLTQAAFDLGGSDIYFPVVINSPAGMDLTSLALNNWAFAFTISFAPAKTLTALKGVKIIDRVNNTELSAANGGTALFTRLEMGATNQLTQRYFNGLKDLDKTDNVDEKPKSFSIEGIFPNPASTTVNVIINSLKKEEVTMVLMDVNGKTIRQKVVNAEIGSNTVPVEIGSLANGSYLVKVLCKSSDCETAVSKFAKQ